MPSAAVTEACEQLLTIRGYGVGPGFVAHYLRTESLRFEQADVSCLAHAGVSRTELELYALATASCARTDLDCRTPVGPLACEDMVALASSGTDATRLAHTLRGTDQLVGLADLLCLMENVGRPYARSCIAAYIATGAHLHLDDGSDDLQ